MNKGDIVKIINDSHVMLGFTKTRLVPTKYGKLLHRYGHKIVVKKSKEKTVEAWYAIETDDTNYQHTLNDNQIFLLKKEV